MSNSDETLLTVLRATSSARQTPRLEAEVVRAAGTMLDLPDAALVEAIDRLAKAGKVRLSFGGTVEIADGALAFQGGGIVAGGDIIAGGNIVVGHNIAIGANASVVLGQLAAAKAELARDPCPEAQALTKAADDLAKIANAPKAPGMGERMKTVGSAIDKGLTLPGKVAGAAEAMKKAYDIVAPWVGL